MFYLLVMSFSPVAKPTSSFADVAKPASGFAKVAKMLKTDNFIFQDSNNFIFQDSNNFIFDLKEEGVWTKQAKPVA